MQQEPMYEQVGDILRRWRKARRISQMELAFEARVSARHLSFVETGRATPSQDLVLRLAEALKLPLRHTNTLLVAGGYAPQFSTWSLEDDYTGVIRAALERLLDQHAPYPAVVTTRTYDVVIYNSGLQHLAAWLNPDVDLLDKYPNMYQLVFAKEGVRPYIANWQTFAATLLKRLHEESVLFQSNALAELYASCAATFDAETNSSTIDISLQNTTEAQLPVATLTLCKGDVELSFFSTVTTFGTPIDVTLQELRIESLYAADNLTQRFFEASYP